MRSIIIAASVALASSAFIAPAMAQDTVRTNPSGCHTPTREENLPRKVTWVCPEGLYETRRVDGGTTFVLIRWMSADEAGAREDLERHERRNRSYRYDYRGRRINCNSIMGSGYDFCIAERIRERDRQRDPDVHCRDSRYRYTSATCLNQRY